MLRHHPQHQQLDVDTEGSAQHILEIHHEGLNGPHHSLMDDNAILIAVDESELRF
jgi:hypothetical protein